MYNLHSELDDVSEQKDGPQLVNFLCPNRQTNKIGRGNNLCSNLRLHHQLKINTYKISLF
jgi:hypothetical protein